MNLEVIRLKRIFTIVGAALAAFLVATIATRHSRPVLVRAPFKTNVFEGTANYALFNPFRDRSPEHAAAAYLDAMSQRNCDEASRFAESPPMPSVSQCEQGQRENSKDRQLFLQPLRDRRDTDNQVKLYYSRTGYEGNWIIVQRTAGEWKVVMFAKIW